MTLPYMDLAGCVSRPSTRPCKTTRGHKGRAAKLLGVHANTLTRMLAQMEAESTGSTSFLSGQRRPRRPNKPR